jgi:phosphate transport system substrate-binding protein
VKSNVDVIAIVVHPSSPVKNLTLDQLRSIYMGKTTDWSEVGGQKQPIVAVVREKNSGTRGAFNELALDKQEPAAPATQTAATSPATWPPPSPTTRLRSATWALATWSRASAR